MDTAYHQGLKSSVRLFFKVLHYKARVILAEIKLGIQYRAQIYPGWVSHIMKNVWAFLKDAYKSCGSILVTSVILVVMRIYGHPFITYIISLWHSAPRIIKAAILVLVIAVFLYFFLRELASKEQLLRLATRRLADKVPEELRVVDKNEEAELLNKKINQGRKKKNLYRYLYASWKEYIKDAPGLSMIDQLDAGEAIPIVTVNIDGLPYDPQKPEEQLNSLIHVNKESLYKNYDDPSQEYQEKLRPRSPLCRYLTRYKGKKPDPAKMREFASDYVGYNTCLRSMKFKDGKLDPPIETTLELYGNIIDSSDILNNETFLHFLVDRYCADIPHPYILDFLPWRKAIYAKYKNKADILTNVHGRAAAFGISALTVYNTGEGKSDGYRFLRGTRAIDVGTLQNLYHVVPAGMTNVNKDEEQINRRYLVPNGYLNLRLLFEKEFLEEVFSQKWAIGPSTDTSWPKEVEWVCKDLLYGHSGEYRANIYLTGVVFDLLNLRPEVCALIFIRDPQWYADHVNRITQKKKIELLPSEWLQNNPELEFEEEVIKYGMVPSESVLAGVAAFRFGIRKALELIKTEETA